MQNLDINDHISHQQWLINNGFVNDLHKDNLFLYGSLVHRDVQAVEVHIDVENKLVHYVIYVPRRLLKLVAKYEKLRGTDSVIGLWRLKRMLMKEGNLNFNHILQQFVRDYCGAKWSTKLELKDIANYEEGFKEQQVKKQPEPAAESS